MSLSLTFKKKAVSFYSNKRSRELGLLSATIAGISLFALSAVMSGREVNYPDTTDQHTHDQELQSLKTAVTGAIAAQKKADAYGTILSLSGEPRKNNTPGVSIDRTKARDAKEAFDLTARGLTKKCRGQPHARQKHIWRRFHCAQ